jgi:3-oxoacyl-ACP reductase-like protein
MTLFQLAKQSCRQRGLIVGIQKPIIAHVFSREKGENMNNSAKIALVTGGSRGLGRATVEALAQRGVNVVLTYKTRLAEANEVVTRVEALGGRSRCLSAPAKPTPLTHLSAPFRRADGAGCR